MFTFLNLFCLLHQMNPNEKKLIVFPKNSIFKDAKLNESYSN